MTDAVTLQSDFNLDNGRPPPGRGRGEREPWQGPAGPVDRRVQLRIKLVDGRLGFTTRAPASDHSTSGRTFVVPVAM